MLKKLFILVPFLIATWLSAAFEIKQLNLEDQAEVAGVCALFNDTENRHYTIKDPDLMRWILDTATTKNKQYKFFVSKTKSNPAIVTGVLAIMYAPDELKSLELSFNFIAWDDVLCGKHQQSQYDAIYYAIIAVHPHYRRQGVASRLMRYVEQFCVNHQVHNLMIGVYKSNYKAIDCYQKQGFKVMRDKSSSVVIKMHKTSTLSKQIPELDDEHDLLPWAPLCTLLEKFC